MKWNEDGGLFGALAFVEKSKRGFEMFFSGQTVDYRLMSGRFIQF